MKNKKWISLTAAVVLAVTTLPMTVMAEKKDVAEEKLTEVTLNEVAHSIFMHHSMWQLKRDILQKRGWI